MRAMILAAGLGTRLRPITYEIPKPMVPILNRPVMGHIAELLRTHAFTEVIANLHWFPETIREHFGDGSAYGIELAYSFEEELLGTAGGVRKCAEFFGDSDFLVISGDALTDIDLSEMREAHETNGGIATLAVKRVPDTREYGVVITGDDGRIQGFQEKPDPAEALSDLGNCGIYMFKSEIFDYFPERPFVDWANDVYPALLDNDVPFYAHEIQDYWNDVGNLDEFRQGAFDALAGKVKIDPGAPEVEKGLLLGHGSKLPDSTEVEAPVFIGEDCEVEEDVHLDGPVAIGAGSVIGEGSRVRSSVLLPGTEIPPKTLVVDSVLGRRRV